MSRVPLSDSSDWQLKFDEQDVRGFRALDADGHEVGRVGQMIVNTDEERVDAVVLEDGTEYPARDLSIGDGVVYLTAPVDEDAGASVTVFDDYGHVVRREEVGDLDANQYADAFRQHWQATYGTTGDAYDDYAPAYGYGYESARGDAYRDRDYDAAEADLERDYAQRYPGRPYSRDREAVRYGYGRARGDAA